MNLQTKAFLALSSICFTAATSQAVVVVTTDFQTNGTVSLPHTYVPSTTDLINGLAPTSATGNFNQEGTGGTPVLTDGAFPSPITRPGTGGGPFQFGAFATGGNGGGTSLTYTLTTPANLSEIVVYGGWQDSGRDEQSYSVLYATEAAPAVFLPLIAVSFNPPPSNGQPQVTRVSIADSMGGSLTGDVNVSAIRFDFNATENGYSGYSEIDVFAVPEPSTIGLLGLTSVGVLAFRRRRAA
jgi:hypothetical protein